MAASCCHVTLHGSDGENKMCVSEAVAKVPVGRCPMGREAGAAIAAVRPQTAKPVVFEY